MMGAQFAASEGLASNGAGFTLCVLGDGGVSLSPMAGNTGRSPMPLPDARCHDAFAAESAWD